MKKQENEVICANCGCVIEGETFNTIDGTVCSDCFYDDYVYCVDTERYVHLDNAFYCDGDDVYVEYSDSAVVCGYCGQVFYYDSLMENTSDGVVCESCLERHYTYCDECCRYVPNDEYDYEYDCCCDCACNMTITEYHSHDYPRASKSLGIELEVESDGLTDCFDMADELDRIINKGRQNVNFERDGSLSNGFEIITVPLKYDDFVKLPFDEALQTLKDSGFTSYSNEHCGLHVHVSRDFFGDTLAEQCKNISKVINLFEANFDLFVKLAQRTTEQANTWARRYPFKCYSEALERVESCEAITYHSERYRAVNISNDRTIEYRLGRGTLNYQSFSAWIELVYLITINCKSVPSFLSDSIELYLQGASDNLKEYLNRKGVSICA